jgi:trans-aconitate 2-methyltransferase
VSGQPLDWDAATYDRVAGPQEQWAAEIIARMNLRGDEVVLDAGCGSGRVTRLLRASVPQGRVIGVDASPSMIDNAREALAGEPGIDLYCENLLALDLPETVDAIFSCAVFHHITDHERLFASLRSALLPGGRLVAQCGGEGNIAEFRDAADSVATMPPWDEYFADMQAPWYYAGQDLTQQRLHAAGFADVKCWLQDKPTIPDDARDFAQSVLLNYHVEHLRDLVDPVTADELAGAFVDDVLAETGDPLELHYVRLNIDATAV